MIIHDKSALPGRVVAVVTSLSNYLPSTIVASTYRKKQKKQKKKTTKKKKQQQQTNKKKKKKKVGVDRTKYCSWLRTGSQICL